MKHLILGDIHADKKFWGNKEIYFEEIQRIKKFVLETVEQHKPDVLINLGDVFHSFRQSKVDLIALMEMHDLYSQLLEKVDIVTLTGNHDYFADRGDKYNVLKSLQFDSEDHTSKIYSNDVFFDVYSATNTLYVYVPYMKDEEYIKDSFDMIKEKIQDERGFDHVYVFGHFDLAEAYSVLKTSDGDDAGVSISDMSFMSEVNKVYLGHWHKRKTLQKGKIEYIGSMRNLVFDDLENVDKGAVILDIAPTGGVEELFVQNPYCSEFFKCKISELETKFADYNFDKKRHYFLKLIYQKGDKHKDMLLSNLDFMKNFDYIVREYDNELKQEDIDLLEVGVSRDQSQDLNNFMDVFREYVKKSKQFNLGKDEIQIAEELFEKQEV